MQQANAQRVFAYSVWPIYSEKQETQADSVLRFAREVIALRKAYPELHAGSMLDAPEGVLALARVHEGRRLIFLFNMDVVPKKMSGLQFSGLVLGRHEEAGGSTVMLGVSGFCLLRE